MLRNFNGWELLIVLVLVLLLFGAGRITKVAQELGSGIRAFKEGLRGNTDEKASEEKTDQNKENKA